MKSTLKSFPLPKMGLVLFLTLASGCITQGNGGLTVSPGDAYTYGTPSGETISATYYHLSDDSLSFVKVVLPDGTEYTLPQAVSASGARYTDEMTLSWWSKGDTARVEKRNDAGEWDVLYEECTVVEE